MYDNRKLLANRKALFYITTIFTILSLSTTITLLTTNFGSKSARQVKLPLEKWWRNNNNKRSPHPDGTKIVLFWTGFFSSGWDSHFKDFGGNTLVTSQGKAKCVFTTDRSKVAQASAVVFHGRNFDFADVPQTRESWQRWLFYLLESPHHSGFVTDSIWTSASMLGFNLTMSYHRSADVYAPYCQLIPRSQPKAANFNNKLSVEEFIKRPKDALWFVSNCKTPSKRELLVKKLIAHGIKVDLFGDCAGISPESIIERQGAANFFSKYKFYLAFENSLCDDYVTEKFGRGLELSLKYGIIPIVYGASEDSYTAIAPRDSFINARAFESDSDLAFKMKTVGNGNGVARFWQWHRLYYKAHCNFRASYESLCRKMFYEDESGCKSNSMGYPMENSQCQPYRSSIEHLRQQFGECHTP